MKTIATLLFAAAAVASLAGCPSAPPPPAGPSGENNGIDTTPKGSAPPIDHPPLDPAKRPVEAADAQRLSVAQLRNAFPVVLGNDAKGKPITWMVGTKPGFDTMARTLGEPDYSLVTDEDRTPSPLYAKLMDDAARDGCSRALDADATRADKNARAILRYVEPTDVDPKTAPGIDQNLRYLKLRFHGVHIDATDTTTVAPLEKLFVDGAAASTSSAPDAKARSGWMVVCVALLTAPEFHLY
jgi:hypothetical protein